jgi:hypothetical protein
MSFMQSHGWYCQFLEEDLKTPLPRKLTFASSDKIMELAEGRVLRGTLSAAKPWNTA